ncbi:vitamin B12 ABC transporter permease BtuC [Halolamina salifodinae]|uniref:Cobalamin import system permease protein BtuC n=1 Tax=Halolamina salifodinae TaxID=1202767 RepID=A0A8T4GVX8_9EURY|nr:vitamin B12 ABC transporter permease BtuC [Halolamina salifodinae]MBP1987059.1 iron complex transport system permease protein [Halolamina salifodinae]
MHAARRAAGWSAVLGAALVAVVVLSAGIGPVPVPAETVLKAILEAVVVPTFAGGDFAWRHPFSFSLQQSHRAIVMSVRLPRILLGALVGFALAAAGAVMQGFFRNPMADPSIVGVSSGAAVGAVLSIVAPAVLPFGFGLETTAFAGALVTAFGVYAIATESGKTPVATLLLAGVAVQTFLGAITSFLLLNAGESMREVVYWLMGHLDNAGWDDFVPVAGVPVLPLFVLACFAVLLAYARDLNVLLLGEEEAAGLGIEVERTKQLLLAISALITGAAVAVSGVIGFVGLIVPHVLRLVVGPDHRVLLPTSALAGSAFLVAADTAARSGPQELPVGIVTAAVGAPFFLFLLRKRRVHEL